MITQKRKREELQLLRDEALEAYMNREDFQYDVNADALYRHYKDQYTQLGQKAMQDTMGQAAALTGGYGSSYAQNVGQQAYNSYMQQLGDVVPELYQLAYDRYQEKGNRLYQTYQTWADLEQQAAQQEQWEREYELEERKRQDANRQFQLEQERKNSQTQTATYQPDYWAMLAYHQKRGLNTQSQETTSKKAETANTSVAMTRTQQTEQFVANTESWETVARSGNGYESYEEYLKTRIDSALSKGQLTSGEAAWLISYYTPQIGESTDDQYTSDRFKQLQKQVKAQMANDVDESYIESFLTDAREFVLQTEEDIKNLTWSTATSDQALDKRNTSLQTMKDRANKVRAWLDANKSRITQDSYQQYIQYLDDFADFLDQSADHFKRTTAEFSHFETQEQYDQAVQEYEQTQEYYDKYSGMTANQLTAKAASLPEGKEKNWVLSYAAQTPKTKEELQQELVWAQGQYEYLTRLKNEGTELAALKNQLEASTPGAPGYAELKKRYENMLRQYSTMSIFEDLDGQIAAVEKTIWELKRDEKYNYVNENEDFDTYSRYVSTKSDGWWDKLSSQYGMGYDDLKYEYINGAANGMRSEITEKSTTWDGTITHQFGIYDHMKPDEISIYNYYYAKHGKEQAEEYLDSIASTLEARSDSLAIQRAMEIASEHKVLSSALSIWGNLASGVEYIEDVVDYGIEKIKGNPYASLGSNQAALMSNTIRSTVAEQVDWEIGNWDAFDFLYNTAMSGADSIVSSTLFGKFGGIALGLSAAAQGTNDALSRGMSDGQAFWSGLFSGVFEGLFETVSIGQFSSLKEVAPESLKDIFKNLGKSMLVNASEETLTEIANIGYDTLVNGEFAHYTLEELKSGAWKNALWQVLESGASGLLIGAGMSMVGSTYSYGNQQVQNYQTGKNILNTDGGVDALLNSADQVRSVSSPQMQSTLSSQIDKVNQKPTARNVGQLNATVQAANNQANTVVNQEDVANRLSSKGVSSEKVDGIAEAVAARLNGQELTRTQKYILSSALNSSAVQDVISDIMKKKSDGIDSTLKNAYDEINTIGGNKNGRETALWNIQNQRADGSLSGSQDQTRAAIGDRSGVPGTLGENDRTFQEALPAARRGLTSDIDAFSDDDYATVTEGSALHQVQNTFREEYGIECHVIKESSWTRSSPAYSRDGVVYIREGIDLGTLSTAVPHEATHVMKQQSFHPYVDFILRTPDMLNFQSEVIQKLLDRVADHKKIDPFDASPQQLFSFYDELNAVVYGLYKSDVLDNNEFDYHEYIPGAFIDFASYIQEMDRLHEEFRNQRNVSAQAKAADGGVDALMNLANEVSGVSSADMLNTLTSQIDKVSQNPTARNIGQLYATIQTASNEANASVTPEDVTKMLRSKRVDSKTTADIADAIAARLNGQELTKTQRKRLSSALGSPAVQSVISDRQKTLISQSDNVSPKPAARNVGQLNATVQVANDQVNTSINQADVAKRLLEKGFYSKKAAGVAEAVAARLNGQDIIRTQRSILSSALSSSAVRDTISELINNSKSAVNQRNRNIRENMLPVQESSDTENLQQNQILNQKSSSALEESENHDKIKSERFNTTDDPMREVTGCGLISNPEEIKVILEELQASCVDIRYSEDSMAYAPGILPGTPGQFIIDRNASYSAWAHEYKHFCDDRADGFPGMRIFMDTEKCKQREIDAYNVEIELARKANRLDIVKRLEELKAREVGRFDEDANAD